MELYRYDARVREEGFPLLCGVDEAGRGPLAGPVVAAAVILPPAGVLSSADQRLQKAVGKKERGPF